MPPMSTTVLKCNMNTGSSWCLAGRLLSDLIEGAIDVNDFRALVLKEMPPIPSWMGGENPTDEQIQEAVINLLNSRFFWSNYSLILLQPQ